MSILVQFDDAQALTGARLSTLQCISAIYGTHHAMQFTFAAGSGGVLVPVDLTGFGVAEWGVLLMPGFGSKQELWSTKTVTVTSSGMSFELFVDTPIAYRYCEGRPASPCLLCLKGYTRAGDPQSLKVNIMLPVVMSSNEAAQPRYDAVETLIARNEAKAFRDEAEESAEDAAASESAAAASASAALAAKVAAEAAQEAAEDAQEAAETAQAAAEDAQEAAEESEDNAKDSENAAKASENLAGTKAGQATASASAASISATSADTSADSAAAYALQAQSSATVAVNAANKIPDPTAADVNKAPVVNAQGKYVLAPPPSGQWGSIAGTLSNQTDLQTALDGKVSDVKIEGTSIVTSGVANIPKMQGIMAGNFGVARIFNNVIYGITLDGYGGLKLYDADNAVIDNRQYSRAITPTNLNYAVRSVLPNVTEIPAGTSAFSLLDASATTNSHCWNYSHTPTAQPTYTLPTVSSASVAHNISLRVHFSADMTSAPVFLSPDGSTVITPKGTYTITATSIVEYLCEYDSVAGWVIFPKELA